MFQSREQVMEMFQGREDTFLGGAVGLVGEGGRGSRPERDNRFV